MSNITFALVKIISFILSIYILGLGLSPCTDNVQGCNHEHELPSGHDHHDDSKDTCTPFCVCSCCGTFISIPEDGFTFVQPSNEILTEINNYYSSSYSFVYNGGVWHPPAEL